MQIAVIIPAAGQSKRFATDAAGLAPVNKLELDLAGRPVFLRSVELFVNRPQVRQILLAVAPDRVEEFRLKYGDRLGIHGVKVVAGGKIERWETVLNALSNLPADCTHVAVHDAARPLASSKLIERMFAAAEKLPAVIPGVNVSCTLKRVTADPEATHKLADPADAILGTAPSADATITRVTGTVDRKDLIEVQTPQVFEINLLRRAYAQITAGKVDSKTITDDAGLIELLGQPVHVVAGEPTNLKITRPDDLKLAIAIHAAYHQDEKKSLAKKRLFADEE